MNKITFQLDDGQPADFFVLAQTTLNGNHYILVCDREEGDGDALILRDDTAQEAETEEALFSLVEDDAELDACAAVFAKMLGDEEIQIV